MHIPVLLDEVVMALQPKNGEVFFDLTAGGGGHSFHILPYIKNGKLVMVDIDEEMIKILEEKVKERIDEIEKYGVEVFVIRANYKDIDEIEKGLGLSPDIVLCDLGFSSYHLLPHRGFSFLQDGPLDMRYTKDTKITAYDVVNYFSEKEIERILREYGEEKFAKRIAKEIVRKRRTKKIETTKELADIIEEVKHRERIHPATKTFQAIRIFVNNELKNLEEFMAKFRGKKGSRLGIITFHSLEARIVRKYFDFWKRMKLGYHKKFLPKREEIIRNPRSSSAVLRVFYF